MFISEIKTYVHDAEDKTNGICYGCDHSKLEEVDLHEEPGTTVLVCHCKLHDNAVVSHWGRCSEWKTISYKALPINIPDYLLTLEPY